MGTVSFYYVFSHLQCLTLRGALFQRIWFNFYIQQAGWGVENGV